MNEELSAARVERIRRRAHAVLDGRIPARVNRAELALVVVFAAWELGWALSAVVRWA